MNEKKTYELMNINLIKQSSTLRVQKNYKKCLKIFFIIYHQMYFYYVVILNINKLKNKMMMVSFCKVGW